MATKRTTGTSAKKRGRTERPRAAGKAEVSKMKMTFGLDADKIEAIQRCLKKGKLTITVSTIGAIKGGRARTAYIYD